MTSVIEVVTREDTKVVPLEDTPEAIANIHNVILLFLETITTSLLTFELEKVNESLKLFLQYLLNDLNCPNKVTGRYMESLKRFSQQDIIIDM